jgi:hypothetical protein
MAKRRRKHSMQPVVWDGHGVIRFERNPIVRFLLDQGPFDLNKIAELSESQGWAREDHSHFAQLIGYSVSGWGTLSYVSSREWERAHARSKTLLEREPTDPAKTEGESGETEAT